VLSHPAHGLECRREADGEMTAAVGMEKRWSSKLRDYGSHAVHSTYVGANDMLVGVVE